MKKKLYETIGIWEGLKKETKEVMNAITFQFHMYFVVTDFLSQQPVPKQPQRLINYKSLVIF